MSRVEEEREAALAAERLVLQRREQERKAKERAASDSAFAQLVQQQQTQKAQGERQQAERSSLARSAIAELLEQEGLSDQAEAALAQSGEGAERELSRQGDARSRARAGGRSAEEKRQQSRLAEGERVGAGKRSDQAEQELGAGRRGTDRMAEGARSESRQGDARAGRESLEERREGAYQQAVARGGPRGSPGEQKAEKDQQGGKGQEKKEEKPQELAQGFRLNPALMAPVPVAKPKDVAGSDRLRKLASEIAQKIVERVRVGTNAAGQAEFQIDLRSNVLAGLSVKVSGAGGRIQAVFSGRDREVLKLLREQAESLRSALGSRGLTLEEFRVEEQA